MSNKKTIGILGGMGPEATAEFYSRLISASQNLYNATQDTDYPPILLHSKGSEFFDETGIKDKKKVLEEVTDHAKILEKAGADFIVIPCNTLHSLHNEIQQNIAIPILHLIEEAIDRATEDTVGILCSHTTRELCLYEEMCRSKNLTSISASDNEQQQITEVVEKAMSGSVTEDQVSILQEIINRMKSDGAKSIILGCTELPLVINTTNTDMKVYDTLDILTQETLKVAYGY